MSKDFTEHDIDLDRIYPRDRLRYEGRNHRVASIKRITDTSKPYQRELRFVIIYEQ